MIELYLLLIFIIIAAMIAVENHTLLSSVVSLGAVGLGLCIIFLMLGASAAAAKKSDLRLAALAGLGFFTTVMSSNYLIVASLAFAGFVVLQSLDERRKQKKPSQKRRSVDHEPRRRSLVWRPPASYRRSYFGDSAKVSRTFHPAGRFSEANSP